MCKKIQSALFLMLVLSVSASTCLAQLQQQHTQQDIRRWKPTQPIDRALMGQSPRRRAPPGTLSHYQVGTLSFSIAMQPDRAAPTTQATSAF